MSDALRIVEEYSREFRELIVRYEKAAVRDRADLLDAYNRLARLRDRYVAEKSHLTPTERAALSRVFEQDVFIKGILESRQIGEHVTNRNGAGGQNQRQRENRAGL